MWELASLIAGGLTPPLWFVWLLKSPHTIVIDSQIKGEYCPQRSIGVISRKFVMECHLSQ